MYLPNVSAANIYTLLAVTTLNRYFLLSSICLLKEDTFNQFKHAMPRKKKKQKRKHTVHVSMINTDQALSISCALYIIQLLSLP